MNAQYQPYASVIHGTTSGATTAPMLVPELKMPVASARSRFGNHSATILIDGGKVPRFADAEREPRRDEAGHRGGIGQPDEREDRRHRRPNTAASACAIAARLHSTIAIAKPSFAPMRSMIRPADQEPDRVGELKREDDVGVVDLAPAELRLQRRLQDADHLSIDVVDGRGEEQQARR